MGYVFFFSTKGPKSSGKKCPEPQHVTRELFDQLPSFPFFQKHETLEMGLKMDTQKTFICHSCREGGTTQVGSIFPPAVLAVHPRSLT